MKQILTLFAIINLVGCSNTALNSYSNRTAKAPISIEDSKCFSGSQKNVNCFDDPSYKNRAEANKDKFKRRQEELKKQEIANYKK